MHQPITNLGSNRESDTHTDTETERNREGVKEGELENREFKAQFQSDKWHHSTYSIPEPPAVSPALWRD